MMTQERLISVDFLRGLTVAGMILVNNPGSWDYVYPGLLHAQWNGCTPADLVFPFFLFIVGLSITFALSAKKEDTSKHGGLIQKIIKRTILLFLLGIILNLIPDFNLDIIRIPGVLQRIAIVFFCCAFLFLKTSFKFQMYFTAFLLVLYWLLMTFIPVPDLGYPSLEVGLNLSAWLDRTLLDGHLWSHSKTWDPEGLLSTMTAIASGMIGVLVGQWMYQVKDPAEKTIQLFSFGAILILAGLLFDIVFPINKSLWTSSYVLYTSGIAMQGLAISYWFVDVKKYQKYTKPFIVFGANAITAYVGSEMFAKIFYSIYIHDTSIHSWIYQLTFASWLNAYNASLALAITWVFLFYLPVWWMYQKKIFLKV